MSVITSNFNFPSAKQVPDHSILDVNSKQAYLGNQFMVNSTPIAIADTSEDPLLYILNPATSTKSLFIFTKRYSGGDATNSLTFRAYYAPTTVAAGSAKTPTKCRPAMALASVATCKTQVTAVSNGTLFETIPVKYPYMVESNVMLILDPAQAMLITVQADGQPTTALAQVVWYEL